MSPPATEVDVACRFADRIRDVVSRMDDGVAFQSLVVTAIRTLMQVRRRMEHALNAAISLAHGETIKEMIVEIDMTITALSDVVNAQGRSILNLPEAPTPELQAAPSWWFALSEAIHSMEDGAKRILSLASSQPKGSPSRQLCSHVVSLLRLQHRRLLVEADAWIT